MSDYLYFDKKITPTTDLVFFKRNIQESLKEIETYLPDSYDKAEFPMDIIPILRKMNIMGGIHKKYDYPGLSTKEFIIVLLEISKIDLSLATFMGVQVSLVIETIYNLGSEYQKSHYIPKLCNLDLIGGFALTEPKHGSDSILMETIFIMG